jgi:hypothetical protein
MSVVADHLHLADDPIHIRLFFHLLFDEPGEKFLGRMIFLRNSQVYQIIDRLADEFFMAQCSFKTFSGF